MNELQSNSTGKFCDDSKQHGSPKILSQCSHHGHCCNSYRQDKQITVRQVTENIKQYAQTCSLINQKNLTKNILNIFFSYRLIYFAIFAIYQIPNKPKALLGIWLVPCQQVPSLNPPVLSAIIYTNKFIRDTIHECREASLQFSCEDFLGKLYQISSNIIIYLDENPS